MTTHEPVIVIDKLEKSYGKLQAVRGISMSVERGEIFGLLGPNGSGKTTTIKLLLGLINPTSGTANVLGREAGDQISRRACFARPRQRVTDVVVLCRDGFVVADITRRVC